MKRFGFFLAAVLLLSGCIESNGLGGSPQTVLECANADLAGVEPRMDYGNDRFFLPEEQLGRVNFGAWELNEEGYNQPCSFGKWKGQNKNNLYCFTQLIKTETSPAGEVLDSRQLTLETVFGREDGKFVLLKQQCLIYPD